MLQANGDDEAALDAFLAAVRAYLGDRAAATDQSTTPDDAAVLETRAAAQLEEGNFAAVLRDATASVMLRPSSGARCHLLRSLALLNLGHPISARAACELGLSCCKSGAGHGDSVQDELLRLRSRMESLPAAVFETPEDGGGAAAAPLPQPTVPGTARKKKGQAAGRSKGKARKGAFASDSLDGEMVTLEQFVRVNDWVEAAQAESQEELPPWMVLDDRVPQLHDGFESENLWPPQCDPVSGHRLLQTAYEQARCSMLMGMARAADPTVGHQSPPVLLPTSSLLDSQQSSALRPFSFPCSLACSQRISCVAPTPSLLRCILLPEVPVITMPFPPHARSPPPDRPAPFSPALPTRLSLLSRLASVSSPLAASRLRLSPLHPFPLLSTLPVPCISLVSSVLLSLPSLFAAVLSFLCCPLSYLSPPGACVLCLPCPRHPLVFILPPSCHPPASPLPYIPQIHRRHPAAPPPSVL